MIKITKFTCEGLEKDIVTDEKHPLFSYSISEDHDDATIVVATLSIGNWTKEFNDFNSVKYDGKELDLRSSYEAILTVKDDKGQEAKKVLSFSTGLGENGLKGDFITDPSYRFTEKRISPKVLIFRKKLQLSGKKIKKAVVYSTALGVYDFLLDGKKVGNRYFAPGFTSYKSHLMYQTYDITSSLKKDSILYFVVSGGWAVGSFVFTRKNRITAKRQALLANIFITYEDGSEELIKTDSSFDVGREGPYKEADFYDGETYDSRIGIENISYHKAGVEHVKINPLITADYGSDVIKIATLKPVSSTTLSKGKTIYDFRQNFAGVINLKIKNAKEGTQIIIRHGEILKEDGDLNLSFLRSAKATLTYICKEGKQEFAPTLTYMGFRYISLEGIEPDNVEIEAFVLSSDIKETGSFECSDKNINRLYQNIIWSSRSNFMDIPTDCPQRDERMGWTGDISVFSPTALYCFDMDRFLVKWLKDMKAEQHLGGGIPNTIPVQGYGFPATMPVMAVDFWGDACLTVPYNMYLKDGNRDVLSLMYPTMKKYVNACLFWANLFSLGKDRYIWNTLSLLHFGDWVAPDIDEMSKWQKRSKWTATASLRHTSDILSKVASVLGKHDDEIKYRKISDNVADAYQSKLIDKDGRLENEFQTGYVLPLAFDMLDDKMKKKVALNLVSLIKKNDYRIGTGFPGTPYILFALADSGYKEEAFKMLFNDKCPSWLYEVKTGGTTIWERWDGLDEDGSCSIGKDGTGGMISYNHYASGAVGAFFYQRICGIEPIVPGYKRFKIQPLIPTQLSYAKAMTDTPFGTIRSEWEKINGTIQFLIEVPVNTICELALPDGTHKELKNGRYSFTVDC